jgi:Crinkler effector protein N-terminal domain
MDSNLAERSKTGKPSAVRPVKNRSIIGLDDELRLFCWVLRASDRPSSVKIWKSMTVGHLKEVIKKKKGHALVGIDPDRLDIWNLASVN